MANNINSEWNINTDIYDIVESVDNLKSNYIQDQDESTLALGIFGFVTDTESKKIQSSIIMTGELGNEMFPSRANLTKNVITHALYNNITDINAIPATIMLNIGIRLSDFDRYCIQDTTDDNVKKSTFIIDRFASFEVIDPNTNATLEFHVDYDIHIEKHILNNDKNKLENYVFSAKYDMDQIDDPPTGFTNVDMTGKNPVSNITNPYLLQPFLINIDNVPYILIQTEARQYSITEIEDKLLSTTIIENKTYMFEFDNQFVDMELKVTDYDLKTVTNVTPLPYGARSNDIKNYCWYMFINAYTIRLIFDHRSYIPGLNCKLNLRIYTSLGTSGEFKILKNDGYSTQLFMELNSNRFKYKNVTTYTVSTTDSENAVDAKTKEELQNLIPKAALSRGSLTTETDVLNYFNLIDTDKHRLYLKKKVDNPLSRVWFAYFLMKDIDNNIIPTNTIDLQFDIYSNFVIKDEDDDRYIIVAGTCIKYDKVQDVGYLIESSEIPDVTNDDLYFDNNYYYYILPYNITINPNPLYSAFYLTAINQNNWLRYTEVFNTELQFVGLNYLFRRGLNIDSYQNKYFIKITLTQSIFEDYGIVKTHTDESGDRYIDDTNMKVILVLKDKDGNPYRWVDMQIDKTTKVVGYSYTFNYELETDNNFDDDNKMRLISSRDFPLYRNMYGEEIPSETQYGFFVNNTEADIYILARYDDKTPSAIDLKNRKKIDDICGYKYNESSQLVPYLDEYFLSNIYSLSGGLTLYENYTDLLDTRIDNISGSTYKITGVPLIGYHYLFANNEFDDNKLYYFLDALSDKKEYIDYCLKIFENSMGIDYKYFNTYGPSKTYYIGDAKKTEIGHVDLEFKFRVSPKASVDVDLKQEIISYIKDYIEDLYNTGDLHIPRLITLLMDKFDQRVNFIEYMNFNDFWLGVQHIVKFPDEYLDENYKFIVPEFLSIRNKYVDGDLKPCIEVEIIEN